METNLLWIQSIQLVPIAFFAKRYYGCPDVDSLSINSILATSVTPTNSTKPNNNRPASIRNADYVLQDNDF